MPKIEIDRQMSGWARYLDPKYRYIFIRGGRASGKSHEVAAYCSEEAASNPDDKTLCLREVQSSMKFSSKSLIDNKIDSMGIRPLFRSLQSEIHSTMGKGLFLFQGMSDLTADNAKSLEGFKRAWFEEAQNASQRSLKTLMPTIRIEGSQIIFTWNPDQPDDPIEILAEQMKDRDDVLYLHINYDKNPFLPATIRNEIEMDRQRNPDDFDHIWLGGYNLRSDVRVFNVDQWSVEECEPTFDDELFYGADWGFSQDPTAFLRTWIREDEKTIYVDYEVNGIKIETDALPQLFDQIPEARKYTITADSARPETISYMNRQGFNIKSSIKGKGSVESGIDWLRGYRIVIHPRCKLLEKELRLFSYKVDRVGNILPKLEDANNHCLDALRYALEDIIRSETGGGFETL